MSLNSVSIIGNLTRDPEVKYTTSGRAVANLSIANNRVWMKEGQKQQEVSYFDIEVWGNIAENCAKYLTKGSGIAVDGRLKQDRWEKEGKTQSRVRIVANNVHFLPKRGQEGGGDQGQGYDQSQNQAQGSAQPQPAAAAPASNATAWDE